MERFMCFLLWLCCCCAGAIAGAAESQILWPSPDWPAAEPAEVGLDGARLQEAERYALSAGGSGMIVRHGKVALRWGDQAQRYDIKSATKSFGATALGIAVKDGKIELEAPARRYHPTLGVPPESNAQTGWLEEITILHLAAQTAGFEKPGGYEPLLFRPGTQWHYSDGGPNWLAECITLQYQRDLEEWMFERVFTPLGLTREDLQWRRNQYRAHEIEGIARREFGAGIHANVEALARLGYLYLRQGRWKDEQILPEEFVQIASRPVPAVVGLPQWDTESHGRAPNHYGLLWWNNADGELENVPQDAYWAWGLHDSLIVVIPSLDLVVVRGGERGRSWPRGKAPSSHYDVLKPFLGPIVTLAKPSRVPGPEKPATRQDAGRKFYEGKLDDPAIAAQVAKAKQGLVGKVENRKPPYPPSPVIQEIRWAPADSIVRKAKGSDNWPLTWGDDDWLYTAYGDGNGFEPFVEMKLSIGLAKVQGGPADFQGVNLRSADVEQRGDGARGKKASGMLMVDGRLYMLLRNAANSELLWSDDRGKTWQRAPWRFEESFGCPTFLNFGKNYAGARDEFVYVYSHDSDSAYTPADGTVLARVAKDRITEQKAYEFFAGTDAAGEPVWTRDVASRKPVFVNPGLCYRTGVTYSPGLKRFLLVQILHSPEARFAGGFGIYDAPEPWGPWTTAYFTPLWDVGPGETASIPVKWMSDDGKSFHLVSSGNDFFSVRRAEVILHP